MIFYSGYIVRYIYKLCIQCVLRYAAQETRRTLAKGRELSLHAMEDRLRHLFSVYAVFLVQENVTSALTDWMQKQICYASYVTIKQVSLAEPHVVLVLY